MILVEGGDRRRAVDLLPRSGAVVALETGGEPLHRVKPPTAGVLIVGHEELGIPREELDYARNHGMVATIPHRGPKSSLNVGVAAGIALAWWDAGYAGLSSIE